MRAPWAALRAQPWPRTERLEKLTCEKPGEVLGQGMVLLEPSSGAVVRREQHLIWAAPYMRVVVGTRDTRFFSKSPLWAGAVLAAAGRNQILERGGHTECQGSPVECEPWDESGRKGSMGAEMEGLGVTVVNGGSGKSCQSR